MAAAGALGAAAAAVLGAWAPTAAIAVTAAAIAAAAPALVAGGLLAVVVLQDWVVQAGLGRFQQADEALLAVGLAGLAVRAAATGRLARTPLDAPTILFSIVAVAAAVARSVPALVAALGLLAVWKGPLAFALFARLRLRQPAVICFVRGILALVSLLALVAVAQRLGGAPVYELTNRLPYFLEWQGGKAPSVFLNHNALGHACVLAGLLAAGMALGAREVDRRAYALAGLACLAGLVVSASRESWIAASAALLCGAWLTRSRLLLRVALVVTLLLAVGAVAVYFGSPLLREEIARRGAGVFEGWHLYRLGFSDWAYRGEYRVYVVLKSWEVFLDHWLIGTGPGRFGGQAALVYGSPLYEAYRFLPLRGEYHPLDVFWSRLLAEFGLLGSLAYLWAWLAAAGVFVRGTHDPDALVRSLSIGGGMAWVATVVLAFFAPALEDPLVTIPIWAWAGVVWSLRRDRPPAADRPLP